MNTVRPRRILIVKPSSFGDIVHTLPALDALSGRWPEARIDWLVKEEWAGLLEGQPALTELLFLPRSFAGWAPLAADLRARRYDLVIDFQGLFRSGAATWLSRAPERVGFADAREGSAWFYTRRVAPAEAAVLAVDRTVDLLRQIGAPVEEPIRFPLPIPAANERWADALLQVPDFERQNIVVIHAAARWRTKRWPAEFFARVADSLAAEGARIFLVAGRQQMAQAEAVAGLTRAPAVNLAGRCSLLDLAALLKRATLAISNDSGPMHLAAALGTPVIGLFGPTDPRRVGPYGGASVALKKQFDCAGCRRNVCAREQACLRAISVEDVLAETARFLRRPSSPEIAGACGVA